MIQLPNRSISPKIKETSFPSFIAANFQSINGVDCQHIAVMEPISRVDLVFNLGTLQQEDVLELNSMLNLIFSGTKDLDQSEILQKLDYYGAFTDVSAENNHCAITLYSTPELVEETFSFICKVISEAIFPLNRLELYIKQKQAQFTRNQEKTSTRASSELKSRFYEDKILGTKVNKHHFQNIKRDQLINLKNAVFNSKCQIYLTSSQNSLSSITSIFREYVPHGTKENYSIPHLSTTSFSTHIELEKAIQTSYRLRFPSIPKNHPNYPEILLCSTMIGGYFGSLLMRNIREEKGLTYGIGCQLVANNNYGFFHIASEIKENNLELVHNEVISEIEKLKRGEIKKSFYDKTLSYLKGVISKREDEVFTKLEKSQSINNQQLELGFYNKLYSNIEDSSLNKCIEAANTYIDLSVSTHVTCGPEQYQAT